VKLAQHAHTGEYVAVKIIDLAALKPSQAAKIEREVVCMSGVDHPNVAKLLDYNTTTTYDGFPAAVLTIEYAERGELFDFMVCFWPGEEVLKFAGANVTPCSCASLLAGAHGRVRGRPGKDLHPAAVQRGGCLSRLWNLSPRHQAGEPADRPPLPAEGSCTTILVWFGFC
jgi:hypothetical protein